MGKRCLRSLDIRVHQETLPNGLRIFYMPMPNVGVSYISLTTRMGMDAEQEPQLLETAHAIEHMVADMTSKKHPDAKKMNEEMDLRGINNNAHTARGRVWYWMKGLKRYTDWMIDAIISSYVHPHYDSKVFRQEMKSIEQELRSEISETWFSLDEKVAATVYKGLPSGISERVRIKNVPKISLNQLRKLRALWYQPS